MKCKKLDICQSKVSSFIYQKACQGKFKYVYCPERQTKDIREPNEWAEFYRIAEKMQTCSEKETEVEK